MYKEQCIIIRYPCKQDSKEERTSPYHIGRELKGHGKGSLMKLKVEKVEDGRLRLF